MAEIQKLKNGREERAIQKVHHEEEMALLARERAVVKFHDWAKKEDKFQLDQSKLKSQNQLCEGRIKLIDELASYLDPSDVMTWISRSLNPTLCLRV